MVASLLKYFIGEKTLALYFAPRGTMKISIPHELMKAIFGN